MAAHHSNERISVCVFKRTGRKHFEAQWIDPVTGKKKTRTAGKATKRAAERAVAVIEAELRAGRFRERARITWAEFRERYETELQAARAEKTAAKAASAFNAVERLIGPKFLVSLNADQISRFQSRLRSEGLEEPSIKGHLAHLKASLNWAKTVGLLDDVPQIVMPKRTTGMKGRPITTEEFERMLEKVEPVLGPKVAGSWRHLIEGLWWSGLRLGEALALHWTDDRKLCVDFSGRRPMFRIRAEAEKGRRDRVLPMAPEFAEFLSRSPESERDGYVFNPAPRRPLRVRNGRLRLDTVSSSISDVGEAAGIKLAENSKGKVKYASAHDLPRSFGFRWRCVSFRPR